MSRRVMKHFIKITALLVFCLAPFLITAPVSAIDDPSGTPTVDNIGGYKNLIGDGDVLIFGEYNIPYADDDIPPVPASSTYILRLLNSGGAELGRIAPRVFFDYGYNKGAFSFYFSTADNLTFGGIYTIRISQNPAYFDTPQSYDYVMSPSSWTTAETQEDNRVALTIAVISTAQRLEAEYTAYVLVESGLSGTVLSSPTGETYFRNVIYGIQVMAASLYLLQIMPYDIEEREYSVNTTYENRYGDWVETDVEATAAQFGMTAQAWMALVFALPACFGFIITSAKKFHKVEPGLLVSAVIILMTYMMGWMPAAIFASIYQIMGIYTAYVWFYARG